MKVKHIDKTRNKNNQIIGYKLQDQQGNTIIVKPEVLKSAIRAKKIEVINLTLTSDNRLINTTSKTQPASKSKQVPKISEEQIKLMFEKAKVLGYQITEIPTYCKHKCVLISKNENNHILYIPDDVIQLNSASGSNLAFIQHIKKLQGHIKVIGGHNLKDVASMFYECQAQSLDLSSFDTCNVEDMSHMFSFCQAQSINISNFDTSKVTNMFRMFDGCQAKYLDLSSFNTSNVTSMSFMFHKCQVQSIDLSSFDTSNVKDMCYMFHKCQAQSLDLSSFNTSNVTDMSHMFFGCKAQSLDLSSFDTSNVTTMGLMFSGCQAQSLDLSSFDTSNVTTMGGMFRGCNRVQIKSADPKIIKAYNNR